MRRGAGLATALWLGAAQAGAATGDTVRGDGECDALLDRMGWTAASVAMPAGACFFEGVVSGGGEWRARVLALHGDVDALPDALPSRLTGGAWGVTWGAPMDSATDAPADAPADGATDAPADGATDAPADGAQEVTATFDLASGGGVVRIDRVALRLGGTWRGDLSARIEGLPEVWPAEPGALGRTRIVLIEGALWSETEEASDEGADWAAIARPWIAALARGGGPEAAPAAEALLDALPDARGQLDVALGEAGLALRDILPLLRDGLTPDTFAEIAVLADLALDWTPDAP